MIDFSNKSLMLDLINIGMVSNNILHVDFSMQHPKNYDGEICSKKFAALANLESCGVKANCVQFSISTLDELKWIREFYDNTRHLYSNLRIRTLHGFWKDHSDKIYLSQLFNEFKQNFGDLLPTLSMGEGIEISNMYSIYMKTAYGGISLSSAPTVHNVDLLNARRPTYAYALDGKYYSFPVAQIVNEGIQKGWYNGFKIQEVQ
jgi:hypothetical protein